MEDSSSHGVISLDVSLRRANQKQFGFNLHIKTQLPATGFCAVYGASGSGKTTLLRCIAGLEPNSQGSIIVNQRTYQDKNTFLSPQQRDVGFVFQHPTLFPHMSAKQNIEFAAKRAREPFSKEQHSALIEVLGITQILHQHPRQLSGGEMQRIAIARAVASNPSILLMDEPLAALDEPRKQELLSYLEKLQSFLAIPVLYVSHSTTEVARLAQHVVVLQSGQLLHQGAVTEVFNRQDFFGGKPPTTIVEGKVAGLDKQYHLTEVALGQQILWLPQCDLPRGTPVRLCIAAKDVSISLSEDTQSSILNKLPMTITRITPSPQEGFSLIELNMEKHQLMARITNKSVAGLQLKTGLSVWAQIKSAAILR